MRKTMFTTAILLAGLSLPAMASAANMDTQARISSSIDVQQRTANRTYDVKARGDRNDSRSEVYDEALYKAARKTRKKDYDWFRVIESDVERETRIRDRESGFEAGYERVPYRSCGLLTCRTEYRMERRASVSLDFDAEEESRYTVELEVEMGWGAMPDEGEVYDARQVLNEYR